MQSRANASGRGLEGMACKAGKGTDPFAAIPNRRNRARGPTKAQQPRPMTESWSTGFCGQKLVAGVTHDPKRPIYGLVSVTRPSALMNNLARIRHGRGMLLSIWAVNHFLLLTRERESLRVVWKGVRIDQPTATIRFTGIDCLGVSPQSCGRKVIGRENL